MAEKISGEIYAPINNICLMILNYFMILSIFRIWFL